LFYLGKKTIAMKKLYSTFSVASNILIVIALITANLSYSQIKGFDKYKIGECLMSKTNCNCSYQYLADSSICIAFDWDSYVNATDDATDIQLFFLNDTLYALELSPSKEFMSAWRYKYGLGNKWVNGDISASLLTKNTLQDKADFQFNLLHRMEELRFLIKRLGYDVTTTYTISKSSEAECEIKLLDARNNLVGYNANRLNITNNKTLKRAESVSNRYNSKTINEKKSKVLGKI